ncbi:ABC transporter substrate-binding protein [Nonomuraea sp. NPDC050404]|uniref:ABC transporter substrate-binding protein n=1 Tax=Nonomuraea sp. NPDC050404 TaxID=3155783 RepID=UPI0033FF2BDD
MRGVRPLRSSDPSSVGPYRLVGFLGEGGQGGVYLGHGPSGDRVAVKLLHSRFAEDDRAVRRFLREADAARRVAEFCTARVLDVGKIDGRPYIVGEYVDGPSLQGQVSDEGPLSGAALVRLAVATATALAAIHKAGVIHRDFKPGNVLLGPDGPRVIDFGIATALDMSQSVSTSVVGTPAFMAPEQFLGDPHPASDVFAWAGTIVYAATGRGPFGFGALPVVMHRIINGEPDLTGVPETLTPLLRSALAKDAHLRPTADQLLHELIASSGSTTGAPKPGAPQFGPPQYGLPQHGPPQFGGLRPGQAMGAYGHTPGTAPSRRSGPGPLIAVAAAATALIVGLATWAVGRLNVDEEPAPGARKIALAAGYGSALTSVVRPTGRKGGTVRLSSPSHLESTDPADMWTMSARNMVRLYGRSLTMFKPAPGKAGTQIVPDLAEKLGEPGDGGRDWTYRLRQGVKFQDGTAITSRDVKYAVLRSMDADFVQGSSFFDVLLDLPGGYKGPYETPDLDTDRAIETPDDRTIIFHLRKPLATFDHVVQMPETIPVPEAKDTGKDYAPEVLSSGPYQIESTRDNHLALTRNPHWDPATDPNRTALPDRFEMTYEVAADEVSRLLKTANTEVGGFLPDDEYATILGDAELKAEADAPISAVRTLAVNPQVAPLDNVDCRRAVVLALDLQAVQAASRAMPDQVPTSLVPPDVPGEHYHDPHLKPRGDPGAAREALVRCGRPNGFTTRYIYRELPGEQQAAEAVRSALAKVGIEVELRHAPVDEFHSSKGSVPANLKKEKIGLIAKTWASDWPDTYSFLPEQVDSRTISEDRPTVNVSVRLPQVNELLDQATGTLDPQVRAGLWRQAEKLVADQAVLVPTTWRRSLLLRGHRATDLHVSPALGEYDLVTIGVRAASS